MKKYDVYIGFFWMLIAIFVSTMSIKFGIGSLSYPGPGFFPFVVGSILFCFSFILVLLGFKDRNDASFSKRQEFGTRAFITLTILLAYALSLEYLGFVLASCILIFYLFKIPGANKWMFSIIMTALTVASIYYLFKVLLKAQFPESIITIW